MYFLGKANFYSWDVSEKLTLPQLNFLTHNQGIEASLQPGPSLK